MGVFSSVPEHVPGHSSGIAVGDARGATLKGEPVTLSLAQVSEFNFKRSLTWLNLEVHEIIITINLPWYWKRPNRTSCFISNFLGAANLNYCDVFCWPYAIKVRHLYSRSRLLGNLYTTRKQFWHYFSHASIFINIYFLSKETFYKILLLMPITRQRLYRKDRTWSQH